MMKGAKFLKILEALKQIPEINNRVYYRNPPQKMEFPMIIVESFSTDVSQYSIDNKPLEFVHTINIILATKTLKEKFDLIDRIYQLLTDYDFGDLVFSRIDSYSDEVLDDDNSIVYLENIKLVLRE
ncbi:MAG: hypothetical protein QXN68_00425 [Thermoplasmata archaeon]